MTNVLFKETARLCTDRFKKLGAPEQQRRTLDNLLNRQAFHQADFDPLGLIDWIDMRFDSPRFMDKEFDPNFWDAFGLMGFLDWGVDHGILTTEDMERLYHQSPVGTVISKIVSLGKQEGWEHLPKAWDLYDHLLKRGHLGLPSFPKPFLPIRRLAKSGSADIYLARHPDHPGDYVVKVFRNERDSWEVEISTRIQQQICHPNVLGVVAGGTFNARPYLVTRFGGPPLDHLLEGVSLAPHVVCSIGVGICLALESMEAKGIVHNDIKPANILYDLEVGKPKLIDFDAASWVDLRHSLHPRLTLAYAAPELRLSGQSTPASDRYSLCLTLIDLLCGKVVAPELRSSQSSPPLGQLGGAVVTELKAICPRLAPVLRNLLLEGLDTRPKNRPSLGLMRMVLSSFAVPPMNTQDRAKHPLNAYPSRITPPPIQGESFKSHWTEARRRQFISFWRDFFEDGPLTAVMNGIDYQEILLQGELEFISKEEKWREDLFLVLSKENPDSKMEKLLQQFFLLHQQMSKDILERAEVLSSLLANPKGNDLLNHLELSLLMFRILFSPMGIQKRTYLLKMMNNQIPNLYERLSKASQNWDKKNPVLSREWGWILGAFPDACIYHQGDRPYFIREWYNEINALEQEDEDLIRLNHRRICGVLYGLFQTNDQHDSTHSLLSGLANLLDSSKALFLRLEEEGRHDAGRLLEEITQNNNFLWSANGLRQLDSKPDWPFRVILSQLLETFEDLSFLFDYFLVSIKGDDLSLMTSNGPKSISPDLLSAPEKDGLYFFKPSEAGQKDIIFSIDYFLIVDAQGRLEC